LTVVTISFYSHLFSTLSVVFHYYISYAASFCMTVSQYYQYTMVFTLTYMCCILYLNLSVKTVTQRSSDITYSFSSQWAYCFMFQYYISYAVNLAVFRHHLCDDLIVIVINWLVKKW